MAMYGQASEPGRTMDTRAPTQNRGGMSGSIQPAGPRSTMMNAITAMKNRAAAPPQMPGPGRAMAGGVGAALGSPIQPAGPAPQPMVGMNPGMVGAGMPGPTINIQPAGPTPVVQAPMQEGQQNALAMLLQRLGGMGGFGGGMRF